MTTVFIICGLVGGTILVVQFLLTLIGFGAEALDVDVPGEVGEMADADADFSTDTDLDVDADAHHAVHEHSTGIFRVLSFRTVVAALAFFGLAGWTAQTAGSPPEVQIVVAVAAAAGAMYGVYYLMRALLRLKAEGTPRIAGAVGLHGTVYTTIPGQEGGTGKIQLNLQNRTMEYLARTPGEKLVPGIKVVVTGVVTADTVTVEPVLESERTHHA